MIFAWLARTAFGAPRWLWAAIALFLLAAAGLFLWQRSIDNAVKADRSASKAEAVSQAREADEHAHEAANRTTKEVSNANDRAREAAAGSDDPLADALRSLRAATHRDNQATNGANDL